MRRRLGRLCILPALASMTLIPIAMTAVAALAATPDYPNAMWVPASTANYSYAKRPHDYPIRMIIIHDTEGTYATAIGLFQDPTTQASAHYVISNQGQITQMVQEKDIAWHAGNWDYNTQAIGIEHEGYVAYNAYTIAEYQASAHLAASICSRYGVPMDRSHVIGHNEVPDPNNPGLYGGVDHHTDPGLYWNWDYYMSFAQQYANALPSPPHMMPDPVAVNGATSGTVTWKPAQTCHSAITGYTVTVQPGGAVQNLPATATSATFNNLTPETSYSFTVTAVNADGQDTVTSNPIVPGRCNQAQLTASPASPQPAGTTVQVTGTSAGCANPLYQFWVQAPGSNTWSLGQAYSSTATFRWNSTGLSSGGYNFMVRAQDANSPGNASDAMGSYDDWATNAYTVNPRPCTSVTVSASPTSSVVAGGSVTLTGSGSGCPAPSYQFLIRPAAQSNWQIVQTYSTSPTFNWNSSGFSGTVYLGVWAKDASSSAAYDAVSSIPYAVNHPSCASVGISGSLASPQVSGTQITFTATASGCSHPSPLYQFLIRPASQTTWQVVQTYSTSPTFNWNSSGFSGTVYVGVWTKDASSAAFADAYTSIPYLINPASCASVGISGSPGSPQVAGMPITFTATASGCPHPNPLYQFLIRPASQSSWQVVQTYSTSPTFNWSSRGFLGTVYVGVWTKDASSAAFADAYVSTPFLINPTSCPSVSISASPAPAIAHGHGTLVTFSAVASGCSNPNPLYEFWFLDGSTWRVVQGWSTTSTWIWNTTGAPAGTQYFGVWVRDAASPGVNSTPLGTYDAYAPIAYSLI